MKFITSIIADIRALLGSLVQPAAPVATVTAPHIRMLLLHLCGQDETKTLWLARWLAYPLHYRGAKMRTAILTANKDGAGHLLFEKVGPMYGNQAQLGGVLPRRTFNGWAIGLCHLRRSQILVWLAHSRILSLDQRHKAEPQKKIVPEAVVRDGVGDGPID